MSNQKPLTIPDEAYMAARFHPQGELAERARTFVRYVVAAELRRIADEAADKSAVTGAVRYADGYFDGAAMVRDHLIGRADELDEIVQVIGRASCSCTPEQRAASRAARDRTP